MYSKGLYDVLTQDEFFILCNELKNNNDKIGLLKVLRHQFDISLHSAKLETENIFNGVSVNEVYERLCKGVLRKPTKSEFIAICESLRQNGVMGTLQRLIAKYCDNVNGETFSNLNELEFSSLTLKTDGMNYPFRYDD